MTTPSASPASHESSALALAATGIAGGREGTFAPDRYERMPYRRCGRSGLVLPPIALGGWQTFGGYRGPEVARACLLAAFNLGITHFDFANNYGTPPGQSEIVCGEIIRRDLPRDELIVSSKAGYGMWPGPYGDGLSKKYLVASCDQSLKRMGLDYFDIFYLHRPDPATPLEESLGALDLLIRQGKVLYGGVSNFPGALFSDAVRVTERHSLTPITVHQPSYSMLNRRIEWDLLPLTERAGVGVVAFAPLANGLLTDKYLGDDLPADSRAALVWGEAGARQRLTPERLHALRELREIARARGQSLPQLALAWTLRHPGVTSALIGASSVAQIEENVGALAKLDLSPEELTAIDALTASRP